jgi:ATP-dependent phosphofructokinase / diphosphate-dependent phosphofructokinase
VIYAAVHTAERLGIELYGIRDGYDGVLYPDQYPGGGVVHLTTTTVRGIANLGGTILGTTNRGHPFRHIVRKPDGTTEELDRSSELLEALRRRGIDTVIAVGGDGSLTIARMLNEKGLHIIGVPKTIDNDLESTDLTFGFQTAVSFATECIERLHATAEAHRRILCVEVMGRYAGWIALHSGIASMADAILVPEIPYDIRRVAEELRHKLADSQRHAIVVVAEGAVPVAGEVTVKAREAGRAERLGGVGENVTRQLQELLGVETRAVVLGHLLRGGSPIAIDRLLGLSFGAAAVKAAADGMDGIMVALQGTRITYVPLAEAISRLRKVPLDGTAVRVARALGISLGADPRLDDRGAKAAA